MTSSTLVRKSAMVAAATVSAVAFVAPARADLTKVPGLNDVQAPVAATIQSICPRLNNRDILPDPTPQQRQLALECSKMVQTSNAQQGSGNMTLNLGLSEEQLRFGLQGIAPDEMGAQSQQSTVASGKAPIAGRLLALRGGARGFSIAGLTGDVDGVGVAAERVNARGGGAAADGPSRWGGFVNVNYNKGDRSTTERQFGFDFDSWGITGGVDYRFTSDIVAGAALTYDRNNADFTFNLGNVDSNSFSLSAYGSWSNGPWYVDGHVSYSWIDYDTRRNIVMTSLTAVPGINTSASGSTNGTQGTISVGAGYDWKVQSVTVSPYARLGYLRLRVDGFSESENLSSLGLDVNSQKTESFQSALGARVSTVVSTTFGVLTPYAAAEWNHEFRDNSRNIVAVYTFDPFRTFFAIPTDGPDRDFYTLSLGVSAQFARGISGFVNVDSVQGLSRVTNTGVAVGLRAEF